MTCSCFFRAFVTCSSSLLLLCSSLFLFQSWFVCGVLTMHSSRGRLRNVEYSILLVMSELSTVRCDRALGLWFWYTGVKCRRRAVVEVLWPMDRAVDGGEGQPGPELGPGGSCGVHFWIEGASGDGRRVSWFAPQNQGGGRRLNTPSRGGTGVGLGTDGGDGRRRRLGPRCGRGGDERWAASRAV